MELSGRTLTLYIDGTSKGNPGASSFGILLYDEQGKLYKKSASYLGILTNNAAEYFALVFGLVEGLLAGAEVLHIYSDSLLLVKQFKGEYKIRDDHLRRLAQLIETLRKGFARIEIHHITRNQNKEADKLANSVFKTTDRLF